VRYAFVLLMALIAASAFSEKASAIESARSLAGYCQSLEKGTRGTGRHIRIPNTKEALLCWGYMKAIQDLSVLAEEDGRRLIGSCPPEQITSLQLIRSFVAYARSRPGELKDNTAVVVIKALQEAFPCHQSTDRPHIQRSIPVQPPR
jgi:hypothetical protein